MSLPQEARWRGLCQLFSKSSWGSKDHSQNEAYATAINQHRQVKDFKEGDMVMVLLDY